MPNTIQHKRNATAAAVPAAGSLSAGELAVNTADGRVYTKRDSGTVVDVAQAILATGQTIVCALGSAGAAGLAPVGDPNTGLFFTADTVNISTNGSGRLQINSNGDIGIGQSAQANYRIAAYQPAINIGTSAGFQIVCDAISTVNGAYVTFGAYWLMRTDIAAGVTDTGAKRAFFASIQRNNKGASGTDAGTISYVRGAEIQYGHGLGNTALTPTTGQLIGLFMSPLTGYGTITDLYDVYIAAPAYGNATVSNHWGIYQAHAAARNYFAGSVGIGRTSPASALDVNGTAITALGTKDICAYGFTADPGTGIFSPATDTFAVATGTVERLRITSDGKVGINGTPSATTTLLQGTSTSATTSGNDVGVNTTLNCAATSGAGLKIGLQSTVNAAAAQATGFPMFGVVGTILSNSAAALSGAQAFRATCSMQSGNGSLSSYTGYYATGASVTGGTVTTQYGFLCESSMTTGTNNYGFTSQIAAGTGRWNLNMTGTAQNYIAGNVGIGSGRTTPATALDINGAITVTGGTLAAPAICFSGDPNTGIYSPNVDEFVIATNGAPRVYCLSNGRVGIGTSTTPQALLGVNQAANFGTDFLSVGSGTVAYPTAQWSGQAGFVSKGTVADGRMLQQDGNGRLNLYWNAYSDVNTGGSWKYQVSSEPAARTLTSVNGTTGATHAWYGAPAGTAGGAITWSQVGQITSGTGGFAWFSPRATQADFYINDAGNVGIGTTTPGTSKLQVVGAAYINGDLTTLHYTETVAAIGNSGTTQTLALTSGTVQTCTLTGNCTFTMPTATAGKSFTLLLKTGAGSFTATFTGVKWPGNVAPTITASASKLDLISFIADGTNWYGNIAQNYTP